VKLFGALFLCVFYNLTWAQGVYRGSFFCNGYTGYPNLMAVSIPLSEPVAANGTLDYKGIAPSGLRFMYMVADDISVGVDLIYSAVNANILQSDSAFYNGQWQILSTNYSIQKKQFRPQIRMDMHLNSLDPNLDQYIGFAVGSNYKFRKVYQDGLLISQDNNPNDINVPISLRACYGFRYFFDYNFALGGELGIGGPIFQLAFTYRI